MAFKMVFIGKSIAHSLLPKVYDLIGKQIGVDIVVNALQVTPNELEKALEGLKDSDYDAACITFPYKTEITNLIDVSKITTRAKQAEAINIIVLQNKQAVLADNTDGYGFIHDAKANNRIEFKDKSILLLGAGGTAKAIVSALLDEEPSQLILCNRDLKKITGLLKLNYPFPLSYYHYSELPILHYDIIINATSASIENQLPPLPPHLIHSHTVCLECAYRSKALTPFGQLSRDSGASFYSDGIGMLVEQAADAIRVFFNRQVETKFIIDSLQNY